MPDETKGEIQVPVESASAGSSPQKPSAGEPTANANANLGAQQTPADTVRASKAASVGDTSGASGTSISEPGNTRVSAGEPLANANARQGIAAYNLNRDQDTLLDVQPRMLPVHDRLHANEQPGYHYHWFGDDGMRIEYGMALEYEFANAHGEACEDHEAARTRGLVKMRVRKADFDSRKNRLNRVVTPAAERAAREHFIAVGQQIDEDTEPFDKTKAKRGPFSQQGQRRADGSTLETDR